MYQYKKDKLLEITFPQTSLNIFLLVNLRIENEFLKLNNIFHYEQILVLNLIYPIYLAKRFMVFDNFVLKIFKLIDSVC